MILFRQLHKWIGLVVGIQVVIWMASGFMMGLLEHDRVQGHHNRSAAHAPSPVAQDRELVEPSVVLSQLPDDTAILRLELLNLLGTSLYKAQFANESQLFDATTGRRFDVTADIARQIAKDDYSGRGQIVAVTSLQAPSMEVRRHTGDVWRIDYDDDDATSLYVSRENGRVLERRNDTWRLFDVFWMLHIMDYQERESFNNWFAIVASLLAAWFAITGVVLFFGSFRKEDFLLLVPGHWGRKLAAIEVYAPHGEIVARLDSHTGGRLYDELAKGDIVLPSNCGGGGTCGLCVVHLAPNTLETPADIRLISAQARREGIRLACQAEVVDGMSVGVSDRALSAELHHAEVLACRPVTPFIREITLLVKDSGLHYHAGSYTHVVIPPHELALSDLELTDEARAAASHCTAPMISQTDAEIRRAYSLANVPEENIAEIVLNVRFMPPPGDAASAMAGAGSSYMWSLQPGDLLDLVGPLGDFQATTSDLDMIFIGGGAGMAPLRSIIRSELLYSGRERRIDFWYGARTKQDLFYVEDLDKLAADFERFRWQAVLSEPLATDEWDEATGLVHAVVHKALLADNRDLASYEFYVCGPPPMLAATRKMLAESGVPESRVFFDDFGI